MMELLASFLIFLSLFFLWLAWFMFKLWRAEKSMTWKPNTCSRDAPIFAQMDCAAQKQRWRDQVWQIATRK